MAKTLPYKVETPYEETLYSPLSYERIAFERGGQVYDRRKEISREFERAKWNIISESSAPIFVFFQQSTNEQTTKDIFEHLKENWLSEVRLSSDPDERVSNENYKKIIDLGFDVVPYLLQDLKHTHTHWFFALQEIMSLNPIKEEHSGNIPQMVNDWMEWSNDNLFTIQ